MTDINQLGLVRTNHCPNCEAQAAENEHLKDVYSSATECFLEADAENEKLREVVDLLLQHDASTFFGPDGEKSKRASYRGVIRKAKKVYAELGETK